MAQPTGPMPRKLKREGGVLESVVMVLVYVIVFLLSAVFTDSVIFAVVFVALLYFVLYYRSRAKMLEKRLAEYGEAGKEK